MYRQAKMVTESLNIDKLWLAAKLNICPAEKAKKM
jgi:hypothetical protein